MAIALARGLDRPEIEDPIERGRDFRETFQIMHGIHLLKKIAEGKKLTVAKKIANNNAWMQGRRTFRGTDFKTRGTTYTKDIAYSEGNVNTWQLVGENPAIVNLFLIGKMDVANPRHTEILIKLGITDEDLNILEATQ
jgi:hypothetical protein